jgi:small-conductance mechanosensitive channel
MIINTWSDALTTSFQSLWLGIVTYVPNLIVAIVIFILGWIVGMIVGRGIEQIFKSLRLDEALKKTGADEVMHRGGMSLNSGAFVGGLVKWFIILVFLVASFNVLGLAQVNNFLQNVVLSYLPQVIVAVLGLLLAGVLGDTMQRIVTTSARAANIRSAGMLGVITRWVIWIFAFIFAMLQLGIAPAFFQTFFTGFVIALALAIGLSFGLGGQQAAADIIAKVRHEMAGK